MKKSPPLTWFSLIALFAIFFSSPVRAVNVVSTVTFDPPAGVAVGEVGIEYVIEAQKIDGTWLEVARGAGASTGAAPTTTGQLSFNYQQAISFGTYTVRVYVSKPVAGDPAQALTTVVPGAPGNAKVKVTK